MWWTWLIIGCVALGIVQINRVFKAKTKELEQRIHH
ncbi:hypothetical protein SAMN04489725_1256 [Alicyclobacillus hesperidum]|uniref:Uncharacterized protein n=1 Tax=Alicyclobacillus hesperidum TaxID=89784 RepID=A0A1H2XWT1_9BACL|nr:hypothetical protein SAMN04489725_1256 [Alicyclobacillus hesperidum]